MKGSNNVWSVPLLRLGVTLQEAHDGRVTLGALDELLQRQLAVLIAVHLPEDLVCPLLGSGLVFRHLHHRPHHLVYSLEREHALE